MEEIHYNSSGKPRIYPFSTISCLDCGAEIEGQNEDELVVMWNTRTPEIMRCEECVYYNKSECDLGLCDLEGDMVNPKDFCSYGERREENGKKSI
ncbi:MAG: hypothetical protein RR581_06895 [Eubacterium sp.]